MPTIASVPVLVLLFGLLGAAPPNAPPLLAQLFPIEVEQQLHDLPVSVETGSSERVAWIRLQNEGDRLLRCSATFRNGPEIPHTRRTLIDPGKTAVFSHRVQREVVKMRIELECEAAT